MRISIQERRRKKLRSFLFFSCFLNIYEYFAWTYIVRSLDKSSEEEFEEFPFKKGVFKKKEKSFFYPYTCINYIFSAKYNIRYKRSFIIIFFYCIRSIIYLFLSYSNVTCSNFFFISLHA